MSAVESEAHRRVDGTEVAVPRLRPARPRIRPLPGSPKPDDQLNTPGPARSWQTGTTVLPLTREAISARRRIGWRDAPFRLADRYVELMERDAVFTAVTVSCGMLTVILSCVALFAF